MHRRVFVDADDVAEVHVQQHMHAGISHVLAPEKFAQWRTGAPKGHLVVLDAVVVQHIKNGFFRCLAVDAVHWAFVHVFADSVPVAFANHASEIHLAHHRRHHMAIFEVEIIVGAVEVGRHHGYVVGAILQIVTFAHLQARNLSQGIFLVGVFQWRGEQSVFLDRLWRILGVDAGGAQEKQLFHTVGITLANHVALHHHVLHDEVGAVERISHNAANVSRRQHHSVGAFVVEEFSDSQLVGQIEFGMCAAHQIVVAALFEVLPNGGAHQSAVPSHIYFRIFIHCFFFF